MKKIALLICGRTTCYDMAFLEFLKNMKSHYLVDIYISANYYDDDVQKCIQPILYQTKSYNLSPSLENKLVLGKNVKSIYNICSMYHHKKQVFENLSNVYDVYMYFRTDFKNTLKIDFPTLKSNTIYLPDDNNCQGFNDRIAFGDYESMKIYMNIDISKYKVVLPEMILKNHLTSHKLTINRIKWNTKLYPKEIRREIKVPTQ